MSLLRDRVQSLEGFHERIILLAQKLFHAGLNRRILEKAVGVLTRRCSNVRRQGGASGLRRLRCRGKAGN